MRPVAHWVLLSLILIWSLFLLPDPQQPLNLLESDENWLVALANKPCFDAASWDIGLLVRPAFGLLGCLGLKLGIVGLSAMKMISWLAFIGIILALYGTLPHETRLWGALFYAVSPLAVFYSNVGLPDLLIGGLLFLAIMSLAGAIEHSSVREAVVGGLALGGCVALKHQTIVYVVIPAVYLAYNDDTVWRGWKKLLTNLIGGRRLQVNAIPIIAIIAAAIAYAPFVLWVARTNAKGLILMWLRDMRSHGPAFLSTSTDLVYLLIFWISLPIAALAVIGLKQLYHRRRTLFTNILVIAPFFLLRPAPRYWVQWMPLLAMLAAVGLPTIWRTYRCVWRVVVVATCAILIPSTTWLAYSNIHTGWFSATTAWLDEHGAPSRQWLFSNYWPYTWLDAQRNPVPCAAHSAWLTTDSEDANIFAVSGALIKARDIAPPALPLQTIMQTPSLVVILEKPNHYADPEPAAQTEAVRAIEARYRPVWEWRSPVWPLPLSLTPSAVRIYVVEE